MTEKIKHYKYRLLNSFIFAVGFVVVGYLVPLIYTKYFDHTDYYKAEFVSIEKDVYYPCEIIRYHVRRESEVNGTLKVQTKLLLVRDDGTVLELGREMAEGITDKGTEELIRGYMIPCNAYEGQYKLVRLATYTINGVEKSYKYESQPFTIVRG